jgi:hypothetical protein
MNSCSNFQKNREKRVRLFSPTLELARVTDRRDQEADWALTRLRWPLTTGDADREDPHVSGD